MLEALYEIGKTQPDTGFIDEFIDDIRGKYKHVFKIIFDITDNKKIKYAGIEYEEFDPSKKLKYFYKKGSSAGCDYTPISKITTLKKTYDKKILPSVSSFLNKNTEHIENHLFFQNLNKTLQDKNEKIYKDLCSFINKKDLYAKDDSIIDGGIITLFFGKGNNNFYIGDIPEFYETLKKQGENANKDYFNKYNKVSIANDKLCYICKNINKKVWGYVNTYNFYTADKPGMVTGGFQQENAWRNYPVCPNCAEAMKRGKKYIENAENGLSGKFCGFNYYIAPRLILFNAKTLNSLLNRMKRYTSFSLKEKESISIQKTEEKILEDLSKERNNINYNFLFYEASNNAFNILLYLEEIAPSRLYRLIEAKYSIDNINSRYDIFKEIKTKKDPISFDFRFSFIRIFFSNKKIEGNFDKDFLEILNNIFIGNPIAFEFILNRFMSIIRREFLNDMFYRVDVIRAYKIILYLEEIKVLHRRRYNIVSQEIPFNDFFEENPIFDDDVKRAVFLEGVLAEKLLNIQYLDKRSKPFRSRLNGLKIDEKIAKRLLPEMINKLEEYNKNYYRELEEAIATYMLKSDFSKYSIDEISFYFAMGMTLAGKVVKKKEEDNITSEEVNE